jgi:thiol:disulfide interchange protein DsbD
VYPLIPITISYFARGSEHYRGRLVAHGLVYVLGLSITNSTLGAVAALTGSLLGSALQSPIVLALVAAVLVCLAASLFGFWELRVPAALTGMASRSYAGYFGTFFMGMTLGVIAAPCLGPFVLGLLTWVAGIGSIWLGGLIFFTLSLGLGLPLLILGLFSGNRERLPGSGAWMVWVRTLMGWVLIGLAAYVVKPTLPSSAALALIAGVILAAVAHLWWSDTTKATFAGFRWIRVVVGLVGVLSVAYLVSSSLMVGEGISWKAYREGILAEAQKANKPVVIDFFAEWCPPCRRLEEVTFRHPEVVKQAEDHFVMVKVDVTGKESPGRELLTRFRVRGVPTVLFFDGTGNERRDLRMVGYMPPEEFLARMSSARRVSPPQARQAL